MEKSQQAPKPSYLRRADSDALAALWAGTGVAEYFRELYVRSLPLVYGTLLRMGADADQAARLALELPGMPGVVSGWDDEGDYDAFLRQLHAKVLDNADVAGGSRAAAVAPDDLLNAREAEYLSALIARDPDAVERMEGSGKALTKPQRESLGMFASGRSFEDVASARGYLRDDVGGHIVKAVRAIVAKIQ